MNDFYDKAPREILTSIAFKSGRGIKFYETQLDGRGIEFEIAVDALNGRIFRYFIRADQIEPLAMAVEMFQRRAAERKCPR